MNKGPYIIILILVFIVGILSGVLLLNNKYSQAPVEQENVVIEESSAMLPNYTDDMSKEEARAEVFEMYGASNERIVGAVVQSVSEDTLIIKTYRAGEGSSSIVEERIVDISLNPPVYESTVNPDEVAEQTVEKKAVNTLERGDRVVIECAENEAVQDMCTAVLITKDVLLLPELELPEAIDPEQA